MLKKPLRRSKRHEAPDQPVARPETPKVQEQPAARPQTQTPAQEYATLGTDAPIAWPSVGGRRVPVTGKLSPHAAAALQRMGITKQ